MHNLGIQTIKKYLPHLSVKLGRKVDSVGRLPAILSSLYSFEELIINENAFLLIGVKSKDLGPRQFKKHAEVIAGKLNYLQIWHLPEMHFHKVQRMIENGFNFIVDSKQVHLPSLNSSIKDERMRVKPEIIKLNGLAVNILIRQILLCDLEGKKKIEIAQLFDVNQVAIGRAIEPLLNLALCREAKEGVSKRLNFIDRQELWTYLKTEVKSPIDQVVFLKERPKLVNFSGITALSKLGMLSDDGIPTFATHKKNFKKLFSNDSLSLKEFATARLEIWNREPLLTSDNRVNLLDCYLVLRDEEDARIQIELEDLLKGIGLEV